MNIKFETNGIHISQEGA